MAILLLANTVECSDQPLLFSNAAKIHITFLFLYLFIDIFPIFAKSLISHLHDNIERYI